MWREMLRILNDAAAKGIAQSGSNHNDEFFRAIRHSNEVFSAFKVHAMGVSMADKLLDENGRLKSFDRWLNDVQGITSHHIGSWLRTEYDTAVLRAHFAADWQEFVANKDILPNLRWMPTTSPDAEATHRVYWEKKLTLPVGHPFWAKHHPRDRWNCKCSLEATDDPATPDSVIDGIPDPKPHRGLENNPGKDGHLINDTHPYFPASCNQCAFYKPNLKNKVRHFFNVQKKDCFNCPYMNACLERTKDTQKIIWDRAREIRDMAKEKFKDKVFIHPHFKRDVVMSSGNIKEFLNQPHIHIREKNELLLRIDEVFEKSTYLGGGKPIDKHKEDLAVHLFEIKIKKDKSWIIVRECSDGSVRIYSITDNQEILKALKEKKD